jgi:hypothetical protein
MKSLLIVGFNFCILFFSSQETLKVTYYNLLNFPSSQQDRIDTLIKVLDYIQPDIFIVNELTSFNGGALIKNIALNSGGANNFQSALFFDGPDTDNLLFYDQNKLGLFSQQQIPTTLRDISEYVLYSKSQALQGDTNLIYFYSLHLKAGSNQTNEELRRQEAVLFKQFLINNNRTEKLFVGGDFNFYYDLEPACQEILFGQSLDLVDPLGQMGNWHNNNSYSGIHTQSTRSATGGYAGGAYGGMDDRFDIIFTSSDVISNSLGIEYVTNSYVSEGQDGNHFNQSINNGGNSEVTPEIANALFYMSDHLPVSLSFTINDSPLNTNEMDGEKAIKFTVLKKQLFIKSEDNKTLSIKIYDFTGRSIYSKNNSIKKDWVVDLKDLNTGVYIVDCISEGTRYNYKFFLE